MQIDQRLIAQLDDDRVFVTANSLNKTLKQAIVDGDFGSSGGGGGDLRIFNNSITVPAQVSSLTGLAYFMAPAGFNVNLFRVVLFEKGSVSSGTLELDLLRGTSPDSATMTSMLNVKPFFNFSTDANFSLKSATFDFTNVSANNFLRLDITSKPSAWAGTLHVIAYGS